MTSAFFARFLPPQRSRDPWWDDFLRRRPNDPRNSTANLLDEAPIGPVNPLRTEVHSPDVMARNVKEFALFLGADRCRIVELFEQFGAGYKFAVVPVLAAEWDASRFSGIGGQAVVHRGLIVSTALSAYIRELGYQATHKISVDRERFAAAAAIGRLDSAGGLKVRGVGPSVHVAAPVLTELALTPDGRVAK